MADQIDEEPSMSLQRFMALEDMSTATFYDLKRRGLAPRIVNPPGTNWQRITAAERRAWHERMYKLGQKEEAKREAERRAALASRAGKLAAQSPLHRAHRGSK
jgi:hypothetical protein